MLRFPSLGLIVTSLALCLLISGCAEYGIGKREVGAAVGGVGGGVLGSQFGSGSGKTAATIAGVLIGAGVGGYIGDQMDQNDKVRLNQSLETTRDGRATTWRNPNTDRAYEVTPTSTYKSNGQDCREFTQEVTMEGGKKETVYGTACRQSDGTWRVTNMN